MIVVPFVHAHLKDLIVHEYINFVQEDLANPEYAEVLDNGYAYTALDDDGNVVCCAGMCPVGVNRAEAWALLSKKSGKSMLGVVRAILDELCKNNFKRVQTSVRVDFKQGNKMMKVLGFECETPNGMKNYGDDGYDYYLYARCV